jgi:predicted transcriptional regulator
MDVQFSPEIEAEITRRAASSGKEPAKFVEEVVSRVLNDEARFLEAVERGFTSLDAGRFVEHDEVSKPIEQRFR